MAIGRGYPDALLQAERSRRSKARERVVDDPYGADRNTAVDAKAHVNTKPAQSPTAWKSRQCAKPARPSPGSYLAPQS
jgi:hypothetical protein